MDSNGNLYYYIYDGESGLYNEATVVPETITGKHAAFYCNDKPVTTESTTFENVSNAFEIRYVNDFNINVNIDKSVTFVDASFNAEYYNNIDGTDDLSADNIKTFNDTNLSKDINIDFSASYYSVNDKGVLKYIYADDTYNFNICDFTPKAYDNYVPVWYLNGQKVESDVLEPVAYTFELKYEKAPTKIVVPEAVAGLVYNGAEQTGVLPGTGYTLTNNTATNAGQYEAVATLEEGYVWEDGSTQPAKIKWSIDKATSSIIDYPTEIVVDEGSTAHETFSFNGDGKIEVNSSDTSIAEASLVETGSFEVKGISEGKVDVTISGTKGANYYAPETVTIAVTVNKPVPPVETVSLSGHVYVKDSSPLIPIEGVVVEFIIDANNSECNVITDADGYYKIDNITKGQSGLLKFTKDGLAIHEEKLSSEYMSSSHENQDASLTDKVNAVANGLEGHDTFKWVSYVDGVEVDSGSEVVYSDVVYVDTKITVSKDGAIAAEYTDAKNNSLHKTTVTPVSKEGYTFSEFSINGERLDLESSYIVKKDMDLNGTVSYVHNSQPVPPEPSPNLNNIGSSAQTGDSVNSYAIIGLSLVALLSCVYVFRKRKLIK